MFASAIVLFLQKPLPLLRRSRPLVELICLPLENMPLNRTGIRGVRSRNPRSPGGGSAGCRIACPSSSGDDGSSGG